MIFLPPSRCRFAACLFKSTFPHTGRSVDACLLYTIGISFVRLIAHLIMHQAQVLLKHIAAQPRMPLKVAEYKY